MGLWEVLELCWAPQPKARPSAEHVLRCLERVPQFGGSNSPEFNEGVDKSGYWDSESDSSAPSVYDELTRILPNFSSVQFQLNLGFHVTRHLLGVPGFAGHVTTMLLGYQDGQAGLPPTPPSSADETDVEAPCRCFREHRPFLMLQPPHAFDSHQRALRKTCNQSRRAGENDHFPRVGVYRH